MTIKDVKEMYEGMYAELEVYETWSVGKHYPNHFHTDNCFYVIEGYNDDSEVGLYELMDEEEYNNSILANTEMFADFEDWYGNKDARILCVMLKKERFI